MAALPAAALPAATLAALAVTLAVTWPSGGRRLAAISRPAALSARRSRRRLLLALAVAIASMRYLGAVSTVAAASSGIAGGWVVRRSHRIRAAKATKQAVVELCRSLGAELRAGRPFGAALGAAAQMCGESLSTSLAPAVAAATHGDIVELAEALRVAATAPSCEGLARVAVCWRVGAVSGAALAPAIDRIADALNDEIELREAVSATLAGARSTLRLLAALPLLGLGLGGLIGARPLHFLIGSRAGVACSMLAVTLDLVGLFWSARISARAVRLG